MAEPGDYLGAFYKKDGNLYCAGYDMFEYDPTAACLIEAGIWMHQDDPATPQKDGFAIGDSLYMKLWKYCDGKTIDLSWDSTTWAGSSSVYTFVGYGGGHTTFYGSYFTPSYSPLEIILDITVQQPGPLTIGGVVTDSHPMGMNGAIYITMSGGTSPLNYSWSNGATTQDISGLTVGSYGIIVEDVNGCQDSTNFTVGFSIPPTPLIVNNFNTWATCNGFCDGAIDLIVSGGAIPYSFVWSNGETNEDINSLCAGIHNLTVFCPSDTLSFSYTVFEPSAITISDSVTMVDPGVGNDGAIDITQGRLEWLQNLR